METTLHSQRQTVVIGSGRPLVMIGERINPTGRKKLGAEMAAGDYSRVRSDALAQVEAGALVLDVNAGYPLGDEPAMLVAAIQAVSEVTDAPICIDSSSLPALEAGLAAYPGKALVNSVTGEDERLERLLPLIKKHGAAVIGLANDKAGIPPDARARLAVARKIVERAQDHGIDPADVLIDPLTLTAAADPGAPRVTLETIRLVREELGVNVVCGASNVSFGLPERPVINAAFLSMAMLSGLAAAITDPTNPALRQAIKASDVLLGHDEHAHSWIREFRARQRAAAAAATATPVPTG
jgi:5-methyltetrahydrofolate--homocysteine methyltransferase